MKNLYNMLEGILDADFDITEDDIKPLKDFAKVHRAKNCRVGVTSNPFLCRFMV